MEVEVGSSILLDHPTFKRKVNNRPEYQVLKKEIIDMGYSANGRKYGVSDNAIRKWIKVYEKKM